MTDQTQEAFTVMVKHLRKQGRRSTVEPVLGDGSPACMYRNNEGLSCAVGCLIADANYSSDLEGKYVNADCVEDALADSGWTNVNTHLLGEMQRTHDKLSPLDWETKFTAIAERFKLDLPEPEPKWIRLYEVGLDEFGGR